MSDAEEWFEHARLAFVTMRDEPGWSRDQIDEAEEEYEEAKRMLHDRRRTIPAVAGPMPTMAACERGSRNTTAQESNEKLNHGHE